MSGAIVLNEYFFATGAKRVILVHLQLFHLFFSIAKHKLVITGKAFPEVNESSTNQSRFFAFKKFPQPVGETALQPAAFVATKPWRTPRFGEVKRKNRKWKMEAGSAWRSLQG